MMRASALLTTALLLAMPRAAAADPGEVKAISVMPGAGRVHVVIDVEGGVSVSDFILAYPVRLVVDVHGATLAAGVALAETAAPLVPRPPELLWPNDLLCDGAKVAGVLVEGEGGSAGLDFLVCGIGVNVNQSATDFSALDESTAATTSKRSSSRAAVRCTGPIRAPRPPPTKPRRMRVGPVPFAAIISAPVRRGFWRGRCPGPACCRRRRAPGPG